MTAADAHAALAILARDEPIDILFSDIVMPKGMDGIQLAREAAALRPGLRVVLASGYPRGALSDRGLSKDFDFIAKPYRWTDLAEMLRQTAQK
jgi:YesN/AraC family two-component response regulator